MFKTGDKIKIKSDISKEKYDCSQLGWDDHMETLSGREFEVYRVVNLFGIDSVGILDENNMDWYFFPEDVENLTDYSKNSFDFIVKSLT